MQKLFTIILLSAGITSSAAFGSSITGIAAVVNSEVITSRDAEKEARAGLLEAEKSEALSDAARKRIVKDALLRLVDKKLVEQKVRELNIKITDEEIRLTIEDVKKQNSLSQEALVSALTAQGLTLDQYKAQLRDQLERLRLVSQEVRSKVVVSEAEVRDEYNRNPSSMHEEETFRARHIFFPLPKVISPEELEKVMALAVEVQLQARGGADFGTLAQKYSQDPSAKDGGKLGGFRKSEMIPELAQALEGLKPGDVSELVQTPSGFHVVKLEERVPGRKRAFDEVKAEIEDRLYRKKSEERFNQWVSELKKDAVIDIRM